MILIQYIGNKVGGERAFKEKTGIEWFPGDEPKEVKEEHAALMLKHDDIFKVADASKEAAEKLVPPEQKLLATKLPEDEEQDDYSTANALANPALVTPIWMAGKGKK